MNAVANTFDSLPDSILLEASTLMAIQNDFETRLGSLRSMVRDNLKMRRTKEFCLCLIVKEGDSSSVVRVIGNIGAKKIDAEWPNGQRGQVPLERVLAFSTEDAFFQAQNTLTEDEILRGQSGFTRNA